ncbi:MAG: poly(R)-hydroxyalkanoic acid synthase subunit PhaE [Bacteroidota bacterium]
MNTTTFFDAWLNTQKELTDNWMESSRRLQEAVNNGTANEKGAAIYQEWLNRQNEITKKAAEHSGKIMSETAQQASNPADAAAMFSKWMTAQQENMNKAFGQFSNPYTSNWNSWMNNNTQQQQWWNNMNNWMNPQQNMFGMNPMMQQWMNPQNNWMNQWMQQAQQATQTDWTKQWSSQWEQFSKQLQDQLSKNTFTGMTDMNAAWMKFNEMWQPMYKSMQENTTAADWMKNLYSADAMQSIMENMKQWMMPMQAKEMNQQWQQWMELSSNYSKHVWQQFAGNTPEQMQKLMPFLMFGENSSEFNPFAMYQRAINPMIRLFNPGKEAEINERMSALMTLMNDYGRKLADVQQHIQTTAMKTMESMMLENFEQAKKGVDLSNSKEVFQNWVNRNEEAFINLYHSEAYSKLQGDLLDLSLQIRQNNEQLMELSLQPMPVVLRSEADTMNQTIYELRKRVHQLEQQINANEAPAAKTTGKKKAATV